MREPANPDAVAATSPHPARANSTVPGEAGTRASALGDIEVQMTELIGQVRADARDTALAVDPALQPFGLKLLRLLVNRGPLQSSAIARALYVDRSVISRQISHLCELGLVEMHTDADDGRVRLVSATPLSLARMSDVNGGEWALFSVLESWSVGDLDEFARLLSKLNAR